MKRTFFLLILIVLFQAISAQNARRIVSLVPWVTKSLYVMGEQDRLVGCTSYCPVDVSAKIQVVASAVNVNIEKTLMLKPDLVFASSLIKPEIIDNLRNMGIKVVYQSYPKSFEEICANFIQIGELVGQTAKAKEIVNRQIDRLSRLKSGIPPGKNPRIFIQIGAKPLFCAMPNTFFEDLIRFSGGENITAALKTGNITREYVLKQNPEIIFIVTMGIVAREEKDIWLKYASLSAGKDKKIFILDSDKICSPTPVLFLDTLEEMLGLMYK